MITTREQLQADLAQINQELVGYDVKLRQRNLIMDLLKTMEPATTANSVTILPNQTFAGMGTTEAIIVFLRANSGVFYTAKEIAETIRDNGLQVNSPNFLTTVHTTCMRKSEGERPLFERGEKDGSKAYRINPDAA